MSPLRIFLLASALLLSSLPARAEISATAWLETYYLNPTPVEVPSRMRALSRDGCLDQPGQTPVAIGFFATLFAQHPDLVGGWIAQLGGLPLRHNRLIAAALWQAGHPLGSDLLRVLGNNSPLRAEIQRLAGIDSATVMQTPVRSESSMNLQWGAFLATGNERYLLNILDAIGLDEPGLDRAAQAALARHAADHPRVLEICQAQLNRQPAEVQSVLRAAVNHAAPVRPKT